MPYTPRPYLGKKKRRKKKVRPARRAKINPRYHKDCTRIDDYTAMYNGKKVVMTNPNIAKGSNQYINQGARVQLTGWTGYRSSYNAVRIVKVRSLEEENSPGLIRGKHYEYSGSRKWVETSLFGDCTARSQHVARFMNINPPANATFNANVQLSSLHKAYAKMKSPECDFGMMAAELAETVSFIRSPLNSMVKFMQRLVAKSRKEAFNKRFYKRTGRQNPMSTKTTRNAIRALKHDAGLTADTLTEMASGWLAARFGVAPMLNDVDSLARLAATGFETLHSNVQTARGGSKYSWNTTAVQSGGTLRLAWGQTQFPINYSVVSEITHKATSHVYYREKTYMDAAIRLKALGISPTQWPSLLYDATPLTFVLDRFVGIGDWLKAIQPDPCTEILGSSRSDKVTTRNHYSVLSVDSLPYDIPVLHRPGKTSYEKEDFTRTANPKFSTFPICNPVLLNVQEQIDHVALIWGRLPSIIKTFKR